MSGILRILKMGDPFLRKVSRPVKKEEIKSPQIKSLISNMFTTLKSTGGLGLAAPQVGHDLQIVVLEALDLGFDIDPIPRTVLINPLLEFHLKHERIKMIESCLSVPGFVGIVHRYNNTLVSFLDEDGKEKKIASYGYLSGVMQHEVDHLHGNLFIDQMKLNLHDLYLMEEFNKISSSEILKDICETGKIKFYSRD